MDCTVTPLKTLMGFSVHLNVQLKFYNLPFLKTKKVSLNQILVHWFSEMQCYGVIPPGIPVRQSSQSSLDRHLPALGRQVDLIGPGAKISANWWPRRVHR